MKSKNFHSTLGMDITVIDANLEIDYTWYPPSKGARDSFMGKAGAGAQLEPDEPESIEINSIKLFGQEITVSDEDSNRIETKLLEKLLNE